MEAEQEDPEIKELVSNSRNAKILTPSISSMRIDAIAKAGFSISRT